MPTLPLILAASESAEQVEFHGYLGDVLVLLLGAMLLGAAFERFRQSSIVGYLLAGALVGPHALGLVRHEEAVSTIAELGVALLLFCIGLEFSWPRLRSMGLRTLANGAAQVALTIAAAGVLGVVFGLSVPTAIAIGAIVSLSSTAVVLRTLQDRGEIDSLHGRTALGILLVQDIAVVPLMLLFEFLGGEGSLGEAARELGGTFLAGAVMVLGFAVAARYAIPRLIQHPSISKNRELPILFAILAGLGSAWAAFSLGLSPALGAFVAGVILGGSPLATQILSDVGPLRTLFVTLFFSAIGMLANPAWIAEHVVVVVSVLLAVVLGNTAIVWALGRAQGVSHRHALAAGLCLSQIGEFSFVLATLARGGAGHLALFDDDLFNLIVSVTIGSLFVTPYLIEYALPIGNAVERALRRGGGAASPDEPGALPRRGHVIIVGFGPAGRAVADALGDDGPPITVIDLNPRTILAARADGHAAVVGDAGSAEIIEHAHVTSARAVVVTLPDHRAAGMTVERVRALCPHVPILARARYHLYISPLRSAGAQVVIDEERCAGEHLGEAVKQVL